MEKRMTSKEIRKRFLDFFHDRNHSVLPSASVVAPDSGTLGPTNPTLFTTAGMQPLVSYLMGESHPEGDRLVSSQKCLRTGDLEEVGDNTHLTFFEMLGNWSLGDYFKQEAIHWSWEFLTSQDEGLGLDPKRLYVTVFAGRDNVPRDMEAVKIWKELISEGRIYHRDSKDNWWSAGNDSPAGPSTEIFYDLTGTLGDMTPEDFEQADENQKVVEIWNNVFMTYRQEGGRIVGELPKKNVDTGAGLERVTAVVQGVENVFETDLFLPLMEVIRRHSERYNERDARIVADHVKTAVFMLQDRVRISNTGRGYVLRRMLRRSHDSLDRLGMSDVHLRELIRIVLEMYQGIYFETVNDDILTRLLTVVSKEMDKIVSVLKQGERIFQRLKDKGTVEVDGAFLADLKQSKGIPLYVSQKFGSRFGIHISEESTEEFQELQKVHQTKSQGKFKGRKS